MSRLLKIADLFCGAGGTSRGASEAGADLGYRVELTAINHWEVAIATHTANHSDARHLLTCVDNVNPRDLYTAGELDILWASPECTHHSVARGGKPINEQSRATAWCVIRWADALAPPVILVENVPEFVTWGGLCRDGRPLKAKKGKTFMAWVAALESLGYRVDWRVLCAADFGDPTTRRRLFVQAVRRPRKIVWPEPTHAPIEEDDLLGRRKPWRAAREIIDWSIQGELITDRKRPLAPKTMRRILVGFERIGLGPFVLPHGRKKDSPARSTDSPLNTVTATSSDIGFVQPFIVPNFGERKGQTPRAHSVDEPLPAVTSHGAGALIEPQPFLIEMRGTSEARLAGSARSLDKPLATMSTNNHAGLVQPFIIGMRGTTDAHVNAAGSTDKPLSTITTKARHGFVEPFLLQVNHGNGEDPNGEADGRRVRGVDKPLPTVCGQRGEWALAEPALLPQHGGGNLRSVDQPVPTVTTDGAIAVVEPYLVKFYGSATGAQSVDEPLDTITAKDRHALVLPVIEIDGERYLVNFRFRMLQPHELAGAQGFPADYKFAGNKTEQVKQIRDAVPCGLARALVKAVLLQ